MLDKNIIGTAYISGQAIHKIGVFPRIGKIHCLGILPEGIAKSHRILINNLCPKGNLNLLNGGKPKKMHCPKPYLP